MAVPSESLFDAASGGELLHQLVLVSQLGEQVAGKADAEQELGEQLKVLSLQLIPSHHFVVARFTQHASPSPVRSRPHTPSTPRLVA